MLQDIRFIPQYKNMVAILDAILDSEVRTKSCSNSPLDPYTRDSGEHFGI